MASWKADMTKVVIDYDTDPKRWFKVMQHTDDVHNHLANKRNEDNLPILPSEKGGIGDIPLLTTFNSNRDVLYQEYTSKSPKEGENEKLGQWYGLTKDHVEECVFGSSLKMISSSLEA